MPTAQAKEGVIYPNPFVEELTIILPKEMGGNSAISLIDESGRVIYTELSQGRKQLRWTAKTFGIGNLSSGIYHIRFTSNEKVIVRKVVKL